MGKAPAFQFYVKDWISDTQLQMASHSTKGIWADMLCYMWESTDKGKITGKEKQLGKILRATRVDFDLFMSELKTLKFGDLIKNGDGTITIINRRMAREQDQRELARKRQQRFREKRNPREQDQRELAESSPTRGKRNKRKYNADITPISPSSSPFSSPSPRNTSLKKEETPTGFPSNEEIKEGSKIKIDEYIKEIGKRLYEEKIFPKIHSFINTMKKQKKNRKAILHTISRCYLKKPEDPWAYCEKIIQKEDGDYNAKDYQKAHKKDVR